MIDCLRRPTVTDKLIIRQHIDINCKQVGISVGLHENSRPGRNDKK